MEFTAFIVPLESSVAGTEKNRLALNHRNRSCCGMSSTPPPIRSIIPKSWNIPAVFRRRLGEDAGRQRLMKEEGHLLVILHQVPKAEDGGNREAALFWIDDQSNWKSVPESGGRSALRGHVDQYLARAKSLDSNLDKTSTAAEIHEIIDQATPLLRSARNLMAVTQELRQALPDDLQVLAIRDVAVTVERAADLLLQDAKSSLEFLIAKNSTEQAEAAAAASREARKLNRLAAFFFPLMTLAAVMGMNSPGEVLAASSAWLVVAIGIALGTIVYAALGRGK